MSPIWSRANGAPSSSRPVTSTGDFLGGLSSGLVYDVPTTAELVSRIVSEAERIITDRLVRDR